MKDTLDFIVDKLIELKIEAEFEDRQRGKKRYVSKTSAYKDLIDLITDAQKGYYG